MQTKGDLPKTASPFLFSRFLMDRQQKQKIHREFWHYTWLNALGMFGFSCYILADTYFIAKGAGVQGLTALNLVLPVYYLFYGIAQLLTNGATIRYAIALGRGDTKQGSQYFTLALSCVFLIGSIFSLIGIFFSPLLVATLGGREIVLEQGSVYLRTLLIATPAFMLNTLCQGFLRNDKAPKLAMASLLISSLMNILLDYIFVMIWAKGMFGAALATAFSPVISLMVMAPFFLYKRNNFHFDFTYLRKPNRAKATQLKLICVTGIPAFVVEMASCVVMLVFNYLLLGLGGSLAVAAYGVVNNFAIVVVAILNGVAQGVQPLLGNAHGSKDLLRLKILFRDALLVAILFGALVCAVVFLFTEELVSLFNSDNNSELKRLAIPAMRIYFVGILFAGANIIFAQYFASTEHNFKAQMVTLLRAAIILVPCAVLLSSFFGIAGIWFSVLSTEVAVLIVATWLYRKDQHIKYLRYSQLSGHDLE